MIDLTVSDFRTRFSARQNAVQLVALISPT